MSVVDQGSAKATILNTLERYGLGSLADFAWTEYLVGIPLEQIFLDIRATPDYKARFPAMEYLAQNGRAMSEGEYINYEQSARSIFKAAGLPEGFYDQPADFTTFLKNDVALPELQSRVDVARTAVYNSDPATLAALENYYNIGGRPDSLVGDLTAYFLDDTRALPIVQQQFIAAQTAGIASRTGYGALSRTEAERLAQLGITPDQAQTGFGTLANMHELFGLLPGEEALQAGTREQGLGAIFEGDAGATQQLEAVSKRRRSEFQRGGGYQESQKGVAGIG
jgi:hypothetical protein